MQPLTKKTSNLARVGSRVSLLGLLLAVACSSGAGETEGAVGTAVTLNGPAPRRLLRFRGELQTPNRLCLDVKGAGTTPGTPLDVWLCNGTPAQSFSFWPSGAVTGPGGQCLDVDASGTLVMNPCTGATGQQWNLGGQRLVRQGGLSGPVCATTPSANPLANDPVILGACAAATPEGTPTNDQWTLEGVPGALVGMGENCIDILDGSTSPGAAVQMFTCSGAPGQTFHFTTSGQIVSSAGLCLEAQPSSSTVWTVDMNTCSGLAAQIWSVSGRSIRSGAGTNQCLDVQYGNPLPHAPLDVAPCNGTQAQQFFAPAGYTEGMATLLVVSDETMAPATSQLVSFKSANAMPAALMTVNDMTTLVCGTTSPPCGGADPATIVKLGIDYFYRNRGTQYVFLAGDATHVPLRFETRYDQHLNDSTTGYYAGTDLYYANLYHHAAGSDAWTSFSWWDDGDGIYNLSAYYTPAATWNPDNVDGYPDVSVGRLDVSTEAQLADYVAKVTSYESTTMAYAAYGEFVEDAIYDWGSNVNPPGSLFTWNAGMAADLGPGIANQTFLEVNYANALQYDCQCSPSGWPLVSPWLAATPASVVAGAVQSGIVTYLGHSAIDGWDAPNTNGYEPLWAATTQTNNYPMVFASACLSGAVADITHFASVSGAALSTAPTLAQFTISAPQPASFDAFSNRVLASAGVGGAIAYSGLQEVHEPGPDLDLLIMVAQRFGAGEKTLGDMWRQAQQNYWHVNLGSSATDGPPNADVAEWELREPRIFFGDMPLYGDPSLRMQRGSGPVR